MSIPVGDYAGNRSYVNRTALEEATKERDSRVNESMKERLIFIPKYHGAREIPWESAQTIG